MLTREEIANKVKGIIGSKVNCMNYLIDFIECEITAAEKLARVEVANKFNELATLHRRKEAVAGAGSPERGLNMNMTAYKNASEIKDFAIKIKKANSSHTPITSTTNNERLSSTEKLNSEIDEIISTNSSPTREGINK